VALLVAVGYVALDARRKAEVQQQLAETRAREAADVLLKAKADPNARNTAGFTLQGYPINGGVAAKAR